MNHQELYKLLVTVQKNVRCPQCGKQYEFAMIFIRGVVEQIVFLELNCRSNHMPLLATVTLSKKIPKTQSKSEKVNSNDVIETYKFLKEFSGGFAEIFKDIKK